MKNVTEFITDLRQALKKNFAAYDKVWVERFRKFDSELMFFAIVSLCLEKEASSFRLLYDHLLSSGIKSAKEFSASSFSKARRKLPFELFVDLSQWVYRFHDIPPAKKWLGMNVFAIDGTVLDLPSELESEGFESHNNSDSDQPQALASVLYDLQKGMVYDAIISQHFDERANAKILLKSLPDNSLLIGDRGHNSFDMFYDAEAENVKLLLRMPESQAPEELKAFIKSDSNDEIVSMTPSKPSERKMIRRGYKPRPVTVRAIKYFIKGQRFIAVTTLLDEGIEPEVFSSLYWCRWDIEECFKLEKKKLGLENFRSKHLQGVLQEFWAVQFLQNCARALIICQSSFKTKKRDRIDISTLGVCNLLRNHLFKLLSEAKSFLILRITQLQRAMDKIKQRFRGGRSFPRRFLA